MFKPIALTLTLAVFMSPLAPQAAPPVFKCTIKGSVTYQSEPCPTGEVRTRPTVEQLNVERQKKLQQAGNGSAKTPSPAADDRLAPTAAAAPRAIADSEIPALGRKERTTALIAPKLPSTLSFKCDGRRYCSQMKSCDEAKYFLANCPGVKMDGDGDGIPCEDQWCTN